MIPALILFVATYILILLFGKYRPYIALGAALLAVFSQISIPVGPVPINLALLAVFAMGAVLPKWEAVIATLLYLALGAAGLPIFSGFNGGFGALAGPTGGYLIGYLPAAYLAGVLCRKTQSYKNYILGMVLGLVVCYLLGTIWYIISMGTGIWQALLSCVFPFLPGDAVKIALAAYLGMRMKKEIC